MINYLKGTLVSKVENGPSGCNLVIEVNDIGYLVSTNKRVINQLPNVGETAKVFTSLVHKEDAMYLCGFSCREDRDLFNIIQTVSGIGTKVALLLLNNFNAGELASAVVRGDVKALSKTKGVGPKLAQRIILELKDKMTSWRDTVDIEPVKEQEFTSVEDKESYLETESVLLSLGYTKKEAEDSLNIALNKAEDKSDAEELLRHALQWLSSD